MATREIRRVKSSFNFKKIKRPIGRPIEQSYFGRNLSRLRVKKGITQDQLAEALRITRARLGAYEESRNEPPHVLSLKIAQYFGMSLKRMISVNLNVKRAARP